MELPFAGQRGERRRRPVAVPATVASVGPFEGAIVISLIAVYGLFMAPLGWGWALFVWGYALAWFLVSDWVKLAAERIMDREEPGILARIRRKAA